MTNLFLEQTIPQGYLSLKNTHDIDQIDLFRRPQKLKSALVPFDRSQMPLLLQNLKRFTHERPGQLKVTVQIRRRHQSPGVLSHIKNGPDRIICIACKKIHKRSNDTIEVSFVKKKKEAAFYPSKAASFAMSMSVSIGLAKKACTPSILKISASSS